MNIRQQTELREKQQLAPDACLSINSRGRERDEEPCELRTGFQRDRDRIIHCKSFRRLKHKTQVFLSPEGDHYRTRLTHTLEVAQIARAIARSMNLNEDLTEAAALGHDLGHTPFGHAGERALNEIASCGFKHYEQSVRTAQKLEKNGLGLNLTYEVADAILCHTNMIASTIEGRIIEIADKIAYINHDIDDAIHAGIITEADLPEKPIKLLGNKTSKRISSMIYAVVSDPARSLKMPPEVREAFDTLHTYMFERVYYNPVAKSEEGKAKDIVKYLYAYFLSNPEKLPEQYLKISESEGTERAVCDYIAGMSDNYAVRYYEELVIPKSWSVL
ncbi:MAG: deoxyguanosinetriphosphate triphosphohydrolase [Oscillospiraceae bacterium]|nr:deoxyguanosinetriphosphate triphosphohydrolase [Oscillospiraceae bacterium]